MIKRGREKEYAEWLFMQVKKHRIYPKNEAIYGGAMALDVSPVTTARYLNKLTSEQGNFKFVRGPNAREGFVSIKDFPFSSTMEMERQGFNLP